MFCRLCWFAVGYAVLLLGGNVSSGKATAVLQGKSLHCGPALLHSETCEVTGNGPLIACGGGVHI